MATKALSQKGSPAEGKTEKRHRASKAPKEPALNTVRELFYAIAALGEQIPPEERAKIPTDFAKNIDHYLYGHPKVD